MIDKITGLSQDAVAGKVAKDLKNGRVADAAARSAVSYGGVKAGAAAGTAIGGPAGLIVGGLIAIAANVFASSD
ncbi:MAG: hypothetical protein IJ575_04575 [Selenomonadaceae bacterium]|nr:hypothetical protein [Selenomonadaceae bacterium]